MSDTSPLIRVDGAKIYLDKELVAIMMPGLTCNTVARLEDIVLSNTQELRKDLTARAKQMEELIETQMTAFQECVGKLVRDIVKDYNK